MSLLVRLGCKVRQDSTSDILLINLGVSGGKCSRRLLFTNCAQGEEVKRSAEFPRTLK